MKKAILWGCVCTMLALAGCQGGPDSSSPADSGRSQKATRTGRPSREPARQKVVSVPVKPLQKQTPLATTVEADRLYLAGEYAKAYDLYVRSIRTRSSELDAHDGLSRCAAELKRYNEGCGVYEKMLRGNPNEPFVLYGAARMYLTTGDRQLASSTAYRSVRFNPNLSRSYYLIALMQTTDSMPRLDSAKRAFEQALEREADYGPAYYQLALLEVGNGGSRSRAKAMASKALETLRPVEKTVRSETRVLLGALCAADQDYGKALEVFRQGLAEEGPSFYEKADVGLLLQRMGKPEEARQEWNKVIEAYGLAHPTGIAAYRELFKYQTGNLDCSAFLPRGASRADYRDLVFYLGKAGVVKGVTVPKELQAAMDEYRTPVFYEKVDLDGDGKEESIAVDARPTLDMGQEWKGQNLPRLEKHWRLANPNLYVFSDRGGLIGSYASHMDHFYRADAVDFNNDGKKEIILTEFEGGNLMNLVVLVKRDVQYHPALVCRVECAEAPCGVLVADLDGDGRRELMTVSGSPLWVDLYRLGPEGTFVQCQSDFPHFYRDYLARYGKTNEGTLGTSPLLREHLARAREILATANASHGAAKESVVKTSSSSKDESGAKQP